MYKVSICDDDNEFIEYFKKQIFQCKNQYKVHITEFYSGKELLENLCMDTDVVFLDMQMPEMDGKETAMALRSLKYTSLLVFCSGVCFPTPEIIKTLPFRYIMKQYPEEQLQNELSEIFEAINERRSMPCITAHCGADTVNIITEDILYISRYKRGSRIFVNPERVEFDTSKNWVYSKNLNVLYEQLRKYDFSYAHNSYIVNLHSIARITRTELELLDNTILSIARSKEKTLRKDFEYYITYNSRDEGGG